MKFYYESNYDICSEVIRNEEYDLIFSDVLTEMDTNYIWHKSGDIKYILEETKKEFLKRNHKQVVYITPLSEQKSNKTLDKIQEFFDYLYVYRL